MTLIYLLIRHRIGLCRTAEIFGVSEFVIGSLDYVKDQAFQNLSVTSHKWLPIIEVFIQSAGDKSNIVHVDLLN